MPTLSQNLKQTFQKISYVFALAFIIILYNTQPVDAAWYNGSWLYRKQITIDNTKVEGSSSHTSFPVLINLTSDSDLSTRAQADGDDILFTSSDETTKLDHEIEHFNSGTGKLIAWVEVPTLSHNTDTIIYMYYGNNGASNQQSQNATWNGNYKAVYHLNESGNGTSGEFNDSTSNNNDATGGGGSSSNTPAQTSSGKIYNAQSFDGANDYVNKTSFSSPVSGTGTISFWVKHDSASTSYLNMLTAYASAGGDDYHIEFYKSSGSDTMRFEYIDPSSSFISASAMSQSTWYFFTGTWDASAIKFYVDGSYINQDTTFTQIADSLDALYVGAFRNIYSGPSDYWPGTIDEVRVNNTVLSVDWITTEYNNQNSPSTFYALGAQEDAPNATYTQSAYRFFTNDNSTDVGASLATQDTAYQASTAGGQFRLRMLVHIATATLSQSGETFKLQYARKSGTCDTSFTGESYADVTTTSPIAFYNNTTPTDATNLTSNANDPTHSGHTIVNQTYEEANNFSNTTAAIPSGQDGKWDFSLQDYGAIANYSYCLRIVKSGGTTLDTYSVIPEVTIPPSLSFSINAVGASTVNNGITTSVASSVSFLPFGNLSVGTPKYIAHQLYAAVNSENGYTVTMNLLPSATIQGLDTDNNLDPFAASGASWSSPIPWTSPTGSTPNIDTGWVGANTTDTRVSGWASGTLKFGPLNTTANTVMNATTTDTGTTSYVTYAIEANVLQPTDMYSGQIIYTITPRY